MTVVSVGFCTDYTGLTPGAAYFVGTTSRPVTPKPLTPNIAQAMGIAITATKMLVLMSFATA